MAKHCFSYEITGKSGHDRISKLLPAYWIDVTAATTASTSRKPVSNNVDYHQQQPELIIADADDDAATIQMPSSPDFLWENEYDRNFSKTYRNRVKCYSHLPNGSLLDDKWALSTLFAHSSSFSENHHQGNEGDENQMFSLAQVRVLPSHCFKGSKGFYEFSLRVGLLPTKVVECSYVKSTNEITHNIYDESSEQQFIELDDVCKYLQREQSPPRMPAQPNNVWVIKDSATNGAGGIWMISPATASSFLSFLATQHNYKRQQQYRYVAQKYAWPPILHHKRKFHVRVYSVMTADASIYVHRLCFLHVANDSFSFHDQEMPATVHITNCCANSHDVDRFTGEIVATLFHDGSGDKPIEETDTIDLAPFFPSISASIQKILVNFFPFVRGGDVNGGFEYMGLDFLLSYECSAAADVVAPISASSSSTYPSNAAATTSTFIPIAYLLEINAPPSQGTANGLPSAELVHDTVLKDLINAWVRPCVEGLEPILGGWKLVSRLNNNSEESYCASLPATTTFNQAAMMNRIRWKLFDLKYSEKNDEGLSYNHEPPPKSEFHRLQNNHGELSSGKQEMEFPDNVLNNNGEWATECQKISSFSRQSFPYFSSHELQHEPIFFESGGGSQVPHAVINAITLALSNRDRSTIGSRYKESARTCLKSILGIPLSHHDQFALFLGSNATSLLTTLAQKYTPLLSNEDEIIIAKHNHEANITPWIEAAKVSGATIRWWDIGRSIQMALSSQTRIVAISHASNVMGCVYDIKQISELVHFASGGKARVVVDGVAAAPHRPALMADAGVDWYVISCHKCFGPHIGALCGAINAVRECSRNSCQSEDSMQVLAGSDNVYQNWENGTVNYEACAGILGVGIYLHSLASIGQELPYSLMQHLPMDTVVKAYDNIWSVEVQTMKQLLNYLYTCSNVQVLEEPDVSANSRERLPVVSFVHNTLSSLSIVQWCFQHKITCRNGGFLSKMTLEHFHVRDVDDGVVRFSLVHYNTPIEVQRVIAVLKEMEGWTAKL